MLVSLFFENLKLRIRGIEDRDEGRVPSRPHPMSPRSVRLASRLNDVGKEV